MSLKRAFAWADAGWPVFPVRENKKPYFADWNEAATTDRKAIEQWWQSVPNAEVGVVPGMVEAYVIDVDVKNGKPGYESLKALETEYDFKASEYPSQPSPSGGAHYFFKGYLPTSSDTLGVGIDTRGGLDDGSSRGYILAYEDTPPIEVEHLTSGPAFQFKKRERKADAATPLVEEDLDPNVDRAKAYLKTVEPVDEGSRGITLFKHACVLKDLGISFEEALSLCAEYPSVLGAPPQDADEAYGRIASAYRNGQLQAGIAAINPETIAAIAAEEAARGVVSTASAPKAKRKRLATWPEIRDKPEPPWIVRNLIPGKSLVGMFGPGGSYKSFVAVDIGLAIAMGRLEWGGQDILTHGPVVVISGEGTQGPRVRAWERANDSVGDHFAVLDGIDLSDPEDILSAAGEIDTAIADKWAGQKPVLLIIDTLARASGGADENSNKEMGSIVAACDELRRHFGCTVLLVHHTPKSSHEWRGATAVYFALDAGLSVKRGSSKRVNLEVVRMKDGPTGQRWDLQLEEVQTGRERDGEPEKSLVVGRALAISGNDSGSLESRQGLRERLLVAARSIAARSILENLLPGQTLAAATLAKQVATDGGDTGGVKDYLKRVVIREKGGRRLNVEHALADCVVTLDPLTFGAPKEKAPEIAPEDPLPV